MFYYNFENFIKYVDSVKICQNVYNSDGYILVNLGYAIIEDIITYYGPKIIFNSFRELHIENTIK